MKSEFVLSVNFSGPGYRKEVDVGDPHAPGMLRVRWMIIGLKLSFGSWPPRFHVLSCGQALHLVETAESAAPFRRRLTFFCSLRPTIWSHLCSLAVPLVPWRFRLVYLSLELGQPVSVFLMEDLGMKIDPLNSVLGAVSQGPKIV